MKIYLQLILVLSLTCLNSQEVLSDQKTDLFSGNYIYLYGAGIAAGTGLILFNNDEIITSKIRSNYSRTNNQIAEGFMLFGDKYLMGSAFLSGYGIAALTKNDDLKRTFKLAIESAVVSGALTQSLKFLIHRNRPLDGNGAYKADGPSFKTEQLSFPSGHTTLVFSTAGIINQCYSSEKYLPYLTYTVASLTGLSRIYDNKHWSSDVLTGAAIGYFSASFIIKLNNSEKQNLSIIPFGLNGNGLTITYRF